MYSDVFLNAELSWLLIFPSSFEKVHGLKFPKGG